MARDRKLKHINLCEESDSNESSTSSADDLTVSTPRDRKGKALKRQFPKKEESSCRGSSSSSSKNQRIDGPSTTRNNGGLSVSNSERISSRRSTRLEMKNMEEMRKRATILSWLIDLRIIPEETKVHYMGTTVAGYKSGEIKRSGIFCSCCRLIYTIEDFQLHSKGFIGDNPYKAISVDGLLGDGSLIPLSNFMESALQKPDGPENSGIKRITTKRSDDDIHDDACVICADGGNLFCCEQCSSTYHDNCLDMQIDPKDPFYCPYCVCKFCVVPISERDSQSHTCTLCGKKYHLQCSNVRGYDVKKFPKTFCTMSCREVHEKVEDMIGKKNALEDGFSWTLLHRSGKGYGCYEVDENRRLECHCKLAVAFRMMMDVFNPIEDRYTSIHVIRNVFYNCGSNYRRVNFCGFLTAILEKSDEIIAVASIRVQGIHLAEMPFFTTAEPHRNNGMCGRLLARIESALRELGVRTLVIPSFSKTVKFWKEKYSFHPLTKDTKKEIMKLNTLMFHDGIRLQKTIHGLDLNEDQQIDEACTGAAPS